MSESKDIDFRGESDNFRPPEVKNPMIERIAILIKTIRNLKGKELQQYQTELEDTLLYLEKSYYDSLHHYMVFVGENKIPIKLLVEKYEEILMSHLDEDQRKEAERNIRSQSLSLAGIESLPEEWLGLCGGEYGPGILFKRQEIDGPFVHRCCFGNFPIECQTARDVYGKAKWEFDDTIVMVNKQIPPWRKLKTWLIYHAGSKRKSEETEIIGEDLTPKKLKEAVAEVKQLFEQLQGWRWVTKFVGYEDCVEGHGSFNFPSTIERYVPNDFRLSITATPSQDLPPSSDSPEELGQKHEESTEVREMISRLKSLGFSRYSRLKQEGKTLTHELLFIRKMPISDVFISLSGWHFHES